MRALLRRLPWVPWWVTRRRLVALAEFHRDAMLSIEAFHDADLHAYHRGKWAALGLVIADADKVRRDAPRFSRARRLGVYTPPTSRAR